VGNSIACAFSLLGQQRPPFASFHLKGKTIRNKKRKRKNEKKKRCEKILPLDEAMKYIGTRGSPYFGIDIMDVIEPPRLRGMLRRCDLAMIDIDSSNKRNFCFLEKQKS